MSSGSKSPDDFISSCTDGGEVNLVAESFEGAHLSDSGDSTQPLETELRRSTSSSTTSGNEGPAISTPTLETSTVIRRAEAAASPIAVPLTCLPGLGPSMPEVPVARLDGDAGDSSPQVANTGSPLVFPPLLRLPRRRYADPYYSQSQYVDHRYGEHQYMVRQGDNFYYGEQQYSDSRYVASQYAGFQNTDPQYANGQYADPQYGNPYYADSQYAHVQNASPQYANPQYAIPNSQDDSTLRTGSQYRDGMVYYEPTRVEVGTPQPCVTPDAPVRNLPADENCSLYITNIPGKCPNMIFEKINEGPVWELSMKPLHHSSSLWTANLVFTNPEAATAFLYRANSLELSILGKKLHVVRNFIVEPQRHIVETRVLIVEGHTDHMGVDELERHFKNACLCEVEKWDWEESRKQDHKRVTIGFCGVEQAMKCKQELDKQREVFETQYGHDPCHRLRSLSL